MLGKCRRRFQRRGSFFCFSSSLSRIAISFVLHGKKMGTGMTATMSKSRFHGFADRFSDLPRAIKDIQRSWR